MFQTQQVVPPQCSFAIENLPEVANITEALEEAGEMDYIFAKIARVGDSSICGMAAVVPGTCVPILKG